MLRCSCIAHERIYSAMDCGKRIEMVTVFFLPIGCSCL